MSLILPKNDTKALCYVFSQFQILPAAAEVTETYVLIKTPKDLPLSHLPSPSVPTYANFFNCANLNHRASI